MVTGKGERMLTFLMRSRSIFSLLFVSVLAVGGYGVHLSRHAIPPTAVAEPPVPVELETVLSDVCTEIVESLPPPQRVLRPTLVLPLVGDREGLFTEKLRAALSRHAWYRPVEKGTIEKMRDTAKEMTGIGVNDAADAMALAPADLASLMKSAKAETLVRGSLDRLILPKDAPAEMKAGIELWEIASDNPAHAVRLFAGEFERPRPVALPATDAVPTTRTAGFAAYRSYAIAVILCLIWPWLTLPWMRAAIRDDSNAALLKAALGITALPLSALTLFLWYRGHSTLDIVLRLPLLGLLLFPYVLLVMSRVQSGDR